MEEIEVYFFLPVKVNDLQTELANKFFNGFQNMNRTGVIALFSKRADGSHPYTFWGKNINGNGSNLFKIAHNQKYNWQNKHWYLSVNSFRKHHRKAKFTVGLNGLWIDADLMNNGIDIGEFVYPANIAKFCKIAGIPQPNALIDSGHGVYFIYLFKHQVIINNPVIQVMWQNLENKMIDKFNFACQKMYGAKAGDDSASDSARVLRMPTTFNVKKQLRDYGIYPNVPKYPECRMLWYDAKNEHDMFDWWVDKYIPAVHIKKKHYMPRPKRTEKGKRIRTALLKIKIPKNIQWQRSKDLVILLKERKHTLIGCRDKFLFIFACLIVGIDGTENTVKDINEINDSLHNPLPKSEMKTLDSEIRHAHLEKYRFKSSTIIKWLNITQNEQRGLLNIMNHKEVIRRKRKRARFRKLVSANKKKYKHQRNAKIFAMHQKGYSKRLIGSTVGVSSRTVSYIIAKFKRKMNDTNQTDKQKSMNIHTSKISDKQKSMNIHTLIIGNGLDMNLDYITKVHKSPS